jgi:toxin-antitoxin system PIN domain toxin
VILPDVNVLVNAFRSDSTDHALCREWLTRTVNGDSRYGISPQVLSGLVRIVTHPRVFARPSSVVESIDFCEVLMGQPHCVLITPGAHHWSIFSRLCKQADARGNLVPDAWFAALAMESGCEWITMDRDYSRFAGLNWRPPAVVA